MFTSLPFFFCIPFFVVSGIELKRLQSWACWACTFTVCSHPIPDRPWGTKLINPTPTTTTKKIKNSKIQNRTLWAVAPHSLWLEYEIETETYRGTCRTGFDDAVKQTLLSEKSCTLESFHHTAAAAWYIQVVLLVKGQPRKSRISASSVIYSLYYTWLCGFDKDMESLLFLNATPERFFKRIKLWRKKNPPNITFFTSKELFAQFPAA